MSRTVAACSLFCGGGGSLLALVCRGQEAGASAEKHKFLKDAGMSYNDIFQLTIGRIYLPTMRAVAAKFGLDELQKAVMDGTRKQVEALAKSLPSRDLPIFAGTFKNPDPFTANTWEMTIVQDSAKVFELRVSECLWAKTFREADAADLGFKLICSADYVTAEAFNPNIQLVRDKTLMQGHDCCNHKYVVKSS